MKQTYVFFLTVLIGLMSVTRGLAGEIYFKNTDRQLEVIRVKGEQPGLTALIFGGIHGDEPGGYFSSEKLSQVRMLKGDLIIVPRVNFPSIMLYRRDINGDMNRKFGEQEKRNDPDAKVIRLLKSLMKEADVFINQHDAHGFHRETYISPKHNAKMYGQSLIIDCPLFYSKKLKREVDLSTMGQRIMERVNRQIDTREHYFGLWDHNSVARNTRFPEMRKSATYYALTTFSIPAFGLETSKDLPSLYDKVKYQLIVIREILHEFGLEAEFPPPAIDVPELYWVEFLKNDREVIRVNVNTNLRLLPGDKLVIKSIYSNYDSGLSADIVNWGRINDVDNEFTFHADTEIRVRKNHLVMGTIYLKKYLPDSIRRIEVEVDGQPVLIPNWGKIVVHPGEYFKIRNIQPPFSGIRFDVRGFEAGQPVRDDANIPIYVEKLLPQYSFMEKGTLYFVKLYYNRSNLAGGFQIEIEK
ncbi:MAG: M99 family carboxypeptidase catalytic domain-containing protein [Candidatus Omnitrophota bacterium]